MVTKKEMNNQDCKGWIDVVGKKHDCNRNRTITEKNSNEESRDLKMCKYCFDKMCKSNEEM